MNVVPPIIAAMPISAQAPASPGKSWPSSQPRQPPKINSGASTPPEVPEASATIQITDFTMRIVATWMAVMWPPSRSPITS
jgi:hypothetical protein